MGRMLVLMRHGKAQSRDGAIPDEQRRLTRAGKRALAARLPQDLLLWKPPACGEVAIWTSPAVRTRQTAQMLADVLGKRSVACTGPVDQRFLLDQDLEAFLAAIAGAREGCIACVGHNPFIEEALALLTGAQLHLSPGGIAAMELDEAGLSAFAVRAGEGGGEEADAREQAGGSGAAGCAAPARDAEAPLARLLWIVQGAAVAPWKTLCDLEDIVEGAQRRMEERLAAFLADPDDVEALHKLRVSVRTLRSLFKFLAPFQKGSQARAVQRDLRSVVVPTSRLRELDVLCAEAGAMEPPSAELAEACRTLREGERDRVLEALGGERAAQAVERVRKAAKGFAWKRRIRRDGLQAKQVAQRFDDLEAEVATMRAETDLADAEATHDLRKAAKRVRYAAEGFAAFLDPGRAEAAVAGMKAVQDELGALCDARVNAEIVRDFPRKGLSGQALRDLDALEAKSRYFIARTLRG